MVAHYSAGGTWKGAGGPGQHAPGTERTRCGIRVTLRSARPDAPRGRALAGMLAVFAEFERDILGIPLIVNTSSGIMNTDSGHREHSPERSDGLASQFIPSESRFSLF